MSGSTAVPGADDAPPLRERRGLRPLTIGVLVGFMAVAVGLDVGAGRVARDQEHRLLAERTGEVGELLASAVGSTVQATVLGLASASAAVTGGLQPARRGAAAPGRRPRRSARAQGNRLGRRPVRRQGPRRRAISDGGAARHRQRDWRALAHRSLPGLCSQDPADGLAGRARNRAGHGRLRGVLDRPDATPGHYAVSTLSRAERRAVCRREATPLESARGDHHGYSAARPHGQLSGGGGRRHLAGHGDGSPCLVGDPGHEHPDDPAAGHVADRAGHGGRGGGAGQASRLRPQPGRRTHQRVAGLASPA